MTDPTDATHPMEAPRCTAHNRQGNRCGRRPIPGGAVCVSHGGAAPAVQAKAKQRLLAALDPAAAELVRIAREGKDEGVRVRAIREILDRAGLPREEVQRHEGDVVVSLHPALGPKKRREGEP